VLFVFEIRAEIVFTSDCNNEQNQWNCSKSQRIFTVKFSSFLTIIIFPDLNKIMKFSYFDVHFEVKPKIDNRPFYFHHGRRP
jgi:hypothetical protein